MFCFVVYTSINVLILYTYKVKENAHIHPFRSVLFITTLHFFSSIATKYFCRWIVVEYGNWIVSFFSEENLIRKNWINSKMQFYKKKSVSLFHLLDVNFILCWFYLATEYKILSLDKHTKKYNWILCLPLHTQITFFLFTQFPLVPHKRIYVTLNISQNMWPALSWNVIFRKKPKIRKKIQNNMESLSISETKRLKVKKNLKHLCAQAFFYTYCTYVCNFMFKRKECERFNVSEEFKRIS